jgi:hypothetical protein
MATTTANPLSNKTALIFYSDASKKASELSIQKITFKRNGEYQVSCVAAHSPSAKKTLRKGIYTIKDASKKRIVLSADELTGQFTGKYLLTLDLLSKKVGTVKARKVNGSGVATGVIKIL